MCLHVYGGSYQLGNGAKGNQESPVQITPPTGVTYVALATAGATSYGITKRGGVWAWGYNVDGERPGQGGAGELRPQQRRAGGEQWQTAATEESTYRKRRSTHLSMRESWPQRQLLDGPCCHSKTILPALNRRIGTLDGYLQRLMTFGSQAGSRSVTSAV
jgi:hypothetical protein